ncbi:MAG: N-acetylmuramoyl-L-alanine amidase [Trueperaceae bacterium]|nr:N-acetylmuramoyl-L-alanine amidase [Trueperaceae bacterium]
MRLSGRWCGLRNTFILLGLLVTPFAAAQQTLLVNGHSVPLDTRLIPGTSFAPAADYAAALGARYAYNRRLGLATFQYAGRFATLNVYDNPQDAYTTGNALRVDGTLQDSVGGVLQDGLPYIPVKSLATAFGGSVDYLSGRNTVAVVFPRATLTSLERPTDNDGYERIVLNFSAPVSLEQRDDPAGGTVYSFDRVRVEREESFSGRYFSAARLDNRTGTATLWLEPRPGSRTESFASQDDGFQWIIDIFPGVAELPAERPHIVLDPGHGGTDNGFIFPGRGRESDLTLTLARDLAERLRADGYRVTLTRDSDIALPLAARSDLASGADLFLSLHGAPLPAGSFNLYYLGDAAGLASLDMAVRQNAASAVRTAASVEGSSTDTLRRRILLGLIPDVGRGELLARDLSAELAQEANYRAAERSAAPLYILGGAAGRGLLLELSPDNFTNRDLAEILADALARIVDAQLETTP